MPYRNVRRVTFGAIFGVVAALGLGCRSTPPAAPSADRKADVRVSAADGTRVVNERTSLRLRLEARGREAFQLYNAGRKDEAAAILSEVMALAQKEEIELSAVTVARAKAVLAGAPLPGAGGEPAAPRPDRPAVETVRVTTTAPVEPVKPPPAEEVRLPALKDPAMADKLISVDFNQVDVRVVIKAVSDVTGLNFIVDENIRGNVTLLSPTNIRLGEVYKMLESVLDVKGYAAVPSGSVIKIVPRADAVKRHVSTRVGNDPREVPQTDTIITQIIPLRYANAQEVVTMMQPLLLAGGHMTSYAQTNAIVFTDIASNVRRIVELIQQIDLPGPAEEMTVIRLKHATATDIAQQVLQVMEKDGAAPAPKGAAPVASVTGGGRPGLRVLADTRTNSLVVTCYAPLTQRVKDLVARLDVERAIDAANIHVVYLENAEAKDVAKSLSAALDASAKSAGGAKSEAIRVTADESTNALVIVASPEDFRVTEGIIRQLDVLREQVLVEMRIIEASEELLRDIGVDWATLDQAASDGVRGFGLTNFGLRAESLSGDLEGLGIGAFKKVGDTTQIGAILKALENHSGVNILSTPHVVTSNHQKATITVAENIPYVKESRVTETDPSTPTAIKTFDYKDVGVILEITPHISQLGLVRMQIKSTFSKLIQGAAGTSADTPTTAQRKAETTVTIASGATLVIGGLIRDDKTVSVKKVPLLGDIPGLGVLFQRKNTLNQKTNLLIFITPHVLVTRDDIAAITDASEAEAKRVMKREVR